MSLPTVSVSIKACADAGVVLGGAVVAWFQLWGPVISGVSGLVAIVWGGASLYFLIRDKLSSK